jgi:hypothetical protein
MKLGRAPLWSFSAEHFSAGQFAGRVAPAALAHRELVRRAGSETLSVRGSATVPVRDSFSANPFSKCSLVIRMNSQTVIGKLFIGIIRFSLFNFDFLFE